MILIENINSNINLKFPYSIEYKEMHAIMRIEFDILCNFLDENENAKIYSQNIHNGCFNIKVINGGEEKDVLIIEQYWYALHSRFRNRFLIEEV